MLGFAGAALLLAAIVLGISFYSSTARLTGKSSNDIVQTTLKRVEFVRNYMTPNYWMAEGLLRVSEGHPDRYRICAIFFGAMGASALFSVSLGWFLAGSIYAAAFSGVAWHGQQAATDRAAGY